MVRLETKARGEAAEHLKAVARRLFAKRGVDGVTVRQIADAAGQKNHGAVGYHFGSKEALVRELVVDGAILIDERRNRRLDELDANGGPSTVREVVDVLIFPCIDMAESESHEDSYIRFVLMLNLSHRDLFIDAVADRWNTGYQRSLEYLRRLIPAMPLAAKNQRLMFAGAFLSRVLAMREEALTGSGRTHGTWSSGNALEHFAQVMTAILEAPWVETEIPSLHESSGRPSAPLGPIETVEPGDLPAGEKLADAARMRRTARRGGRAI